MGISLDVLDPGSIGTYDDLVGMVGNWLDRDDLNDRIPEFVSLLEGRLNRLLRTVMQETPATFVVTSETYALPDDFRKMRKLYYAGNPAFQLSEVSPAELVNWSNNPVTRVFAIEGRMLRFADAATPDKPVTLTGSYWRRIPPLGTFQPTNWILLEHPDIYLWGALHQAATYIRDGDAVDACKIYLDEAIAELISMSAKDQYGGAISPRTTVQVRGARC